MQKNFCDSCGEEIISYDEDTHYATVGDVEADFCGQCLPKAQNALRTVLQSP